MTVERCGLVEDEKGTKGSTYVRRREPWNIATPKPAAARVVEVEQDAP